MKTGIKKIFGNFKFANNMKKLRKAKVNLPLIIGVAAVNHFKEGFTKGGYQTDASTNGWLPRKRLRRTRSGNISTSSKGAILVGKSGGRLKKSIKILSKSWANITIGTQGLKYAAIHNYGLMGKAFGKYPFKMPKREFIGASHKLKNKINIIIKTEMKHIMQ